MFDPRRVLRALYVGRLFLAAAFAAGCPVRLARPERQCTSHRRCRTRLGARVHVGLLFSDRDPRKEAGHDVFYAQAVFDLCLVTAAVHVTWSGGQSQFAPLFILVIAVSARLVTPAGVPLIASLGMLLYFADVMLGHGGDPDPALFFQLVIFGVVAISSGVIAARLRAAGSKSDELAAELAAFRYGRSESRESPR